MVVEFSLAQDLFKKLQRNGSKWKNIYICRSLIKESMNISMKKENYFRNLLFLKSNFFIGAGSIMGLMGNYYEIDFSCKRKYDQKKALRADWQATGDDLRTSLNEFAKMNH